MGENFWLRRATLRLIDSELVLADRPINRAAMSLDLTARQWRPIAPTVMTTVRDVRYPSAAHAGLGRQGNAQILARSAADPTRACGFPGRATRLPPVATLAAEVDLSTSRLQHLVRDQVGIPLSRWLLWRRTLVALDLILNGTTVTEAAYRAGFADGPDFTRRFREFFAAPPTAALQDPRIHTVVCSRLAVSTAA